MKWRQGYETIFPTSEYVAVLRGLTSGTSKYSELQNGVGSSPSRLGIKLRRMTDLGLIKKEERGIYFITPFGSRVLKAYNAYMEIINDGLPTEGGFGSQLPSRSTTKRK